MTHSLRLGNITRELRSTRMDLLCRIADAAREALRWLQDAVAAAVIVAAAIGLLYAVARAVQVSVP